MDQFVLEPEPEISISVQQPCSRLHERGQTVRIYMKDSRPMISYKTKYSIRRI